MNVIIIIIICVYVPAHMYMCVQEPEQPRRGTGFLESGVTGIYELSEVLGTEFQSSQRTLSVLHV